MNVRIASYNLFEGASGSYNRLVEFIREAKLDVLCLQEINHWEDNDSARLKDFTDRILFAASAFGNSNTEYKLATLSKHAILGRKLHAEAFWHAALEVRLKLVDKEISIYNVHLDPWQEASRDREIARLLDTLTPGRPTIITGDFNSLSRQDNYPSELLGQLQANGISKYGKTALEYAVVDRLLAAGFVDVGAAKANFEPTVPSAFNTDKDHEIPVRVDYMFVTPDLAPLVESVERVKTDLTDTISDHYPLIVTFNFGRSSEIASAVVSHDTIPPSSAPSAPEVAPPAPVSHKEDEDGEVVMWIHGQK
ncbi:MAG TPA: endonuclease/exonuclease/phosphatase family protein [Patescibacteria group bacterium]|nr:endonuclease/exonuclease/phosphatase family protein [Patescibacteria group bacterium]